MNEIIQIQVGQCGNQIGNKLWESIFQEHSINLTGSYIGKSELKLQKINVFLAETTGFRYLPRAVLVDLEPSTIDTVRAGHFGRLFKPANFISGQRGAGNNWAKGHYTEGAEVADTIFDVVRKEAEACDRLQGFQMTHSIGGGTGSGLGALVISRLKEEYAGKIVQTFSVFPSPEASDLGLECYNTILSMKHLIKNADITHVFDNSAFNNLCSKKLKIQNPTYKDINSLMASTMSTITCPLRFPVDMNSSLRRLCINLVPFPRLHFIMTSAAAPLPVRTNKVPHAQELASQLFQAQNLSCCTDYRNGRYLSASALFRGRVSRKDVYGLFDWREDKINSYFTEWIPDNVKVSFCDIPQVGIPCSAALIGNSTAIQDIFKKAEEQFTVMFRKKAGLNWYTDEGMDEMEFVEAQASVDEMNSQYQEMQDAYGDY